MRNGKTKGTLYPLPRAGNKGGGVEGPPEAAALSAHT